MDIFIRKSLVLFFSLFFPLTLCALEVSLDQVTGINKRGGEFQFSLENRAKFDFDPDENTLSSSGTWVAENRTGPNLLIRYSHKVENFSVNAKGIYSVKSYECVEGTFGAMLGMNYCGNYRFGPNTLDATAVLPMTIRPVGQFPYIISLSACSNGMDRP